MDAVDGAHCPGRDRRPAARPAQRQGRHADSAAVEHRHVLLDQRRHQLHRSVQGRGDHLSHRSRQLPLDRRSPQPGSTAPARSTYRPGRTVASSPAAPRTTSSTPPRPTERPGRQCLGSRIDATTSGVDHFLPGLGVDPTTSGTTAKLALTYLDYPKTSCTASTCQLDVGFTRSSDGGATWTAKTLEAGPTPLSELPNTSQGPMIGDFLSTAFVTTSTGDAPMSFFEAVAGGHGQELHARRQLLVPAEDRRAPLHALTLRHQSDNAGTMFPSKGAWSPLVGPRR